MYHVLPGTYTATASDGHEIEVVLFLDLDGTVRWDFKKENE